MVQHVYYNIINDFYIMSMNVTINLMYDVQTEIFNNLKKKIWKYQIVIN